MSIFTRFLTTSCLTATSLYAAKALAYGYDDYAQPSMMNSLLILGGGQVTSCIVAALIGAVVGAFFSDKFRKFRKFLFLLTLVLCGISALLLPAIGQLTAFAIGFCSAMMLLSDKRKKSLYQKIMQRFKREKQTVFGSSTWADFEHIRTSGVIGAEGLFLGTFRYKQENGRVREIPMHYTGDRHLMTIAASRAGKGVSSVIPNLLTYEGSVLAIDIKGELALITAERRYNMGQDVHILDLWNVILP